MVRNRYAVVMAGGKAPVAHFARLVGTFSQQSTIDIGNTVFYLRNTYGECETHTSVLRKRMVRATSDASNTCFALHWAHPV